MSKKQSGAESVADVTEAVAEIEMEQDDTNITVDMPQITRFLDFLVSFFY